jgi:hypothetical protein
MVPERLAAERPTLRVAENRWFMGEYTRPKRENLPDLFDFAISNEVIEILPPAH